VCIHKSYVIYFEVSVVPIGHGFSFSGHGKIMENQCWKGGGTLVMTLQSKAWLHAVMFSLVVGMLCGLKQSRFSHKVCATLNSAFCLQVCW